MLSRRSIQRLLDRSHSYLSAAQSESLVKRLNRYKPDAIDAEWELIILSALDSQGSVNHEPQLGGPSNLDVRFQSQALRFIGDVRALSDHTYHKDNPTDALSSALFKEGKKLQKSGVEGWFAFDIRGVVSDHRKENSRPRLHLPPENRFRAVLFGANFQGFIADIKKDPTKVRQHVIENDEARLAIMFRSGKASASSGTYPTYNLPFDLERNIVFRALEHKATQIKRAGQKSPGELAGVILCDSGCWSLRSAASGNVVSTDAIVSKFLGDSETVDFVCIVDIPNQMRPLRFESRVWSKHSIVELREIFARALQTLPAPVLNGVNTRNHFDFADGSERRLYHTYKRECSMRRFRQGNHIGDEIELPLRAVVDYLAGRIDRRAFELAMLGQWLEGLRRRLDEGAGVSDISINRSPEEDDDGLILSFREHDAAAAPFRGPSMPGNLRAED